jgi:hypothetical protein
VIVQPTRREYEPFMLNGDAQHSFEGEPRFRIRPVALFSKIGASGIYHMGILVVD